MATITGYQTDEFGTVLRFDNGNILRSSERPPYSFDYEVVTYTSSTKTRYWQGVSYNLTDEEITEVETFMNSIDGDEELSKQMAQAHQARKILQSTDWYVIRFLETGTPVPDNITQMRAQARELVAV